MGKQDVNEDELSGQPVSCLVTINTKQSLLSPRTSKYFRYTIDKSAVSQSEADVFVFERGPLESHSIPS